jgi:3-hydroxybutyryl-CoA dehydratase
MPEFKVGDLAEYSKTITEADITLFVAVSGDSNPVHVNEEYARTTRFGKRIAHGLLTAGLISAVLGTKLPGPGAIYLSQSLRFLAPVAIGDTVTASATLTEYDRDLGKMTLETACFNQSDVQVLAGEAVVLYRPD